MPADPAGIDPHYDSKHGILWNIPGFTDRKTLSRFEAAEAAEALVRLAVDPVKGAFDCAHLKAIHARIFRSIYPWAGEFRQVNMHRAGSYPFAVVQFLESNLNATFAKLADERHLMGLDLPAFADRAAYYLGQLNAIHPFRDGNGRAQREFLRELAADVGYLINWGKITHQQMYEASIESHNRGNNSPFAAILAAALEPARLPPPSDP